jgi:hypothetical protein
MRFPRKMSRTGMISPDYPSVSVWQHKSVNNLQSSFFTLKAERSIDRTSTPKMKTLCYVLDELVTHVSIVKMLLC